MNAELENLVALQKSDLEIRAIESRLRKIPEEIASLEQEIATERANLKSAEDGLGESKKTRRHFEGELELIEGKIDKYKDQLMQVKTNEEYRAMQKQIQTAKDEASDKEDKILAMMEDAERLHEMVNHRQKELEEGIAEVKEMEAELEVEASGLSKELESKSGRRDQLLSAIPKDLVAQYKQISGVRGGVALAEAKDEHCQVCHVRLRPQVYNELRMGDKIWICDNCSRILYFIEPASPESV